MRNRIAVALVLGTLAFSPALASAGEDTHSLEQLVIEMADSPADHAALAKHFRAKAAAARAEAARHESMGRVYVGGKLALRSQMQAHCRKLAAQNTALADEYEALAKLHDEEAKEPQEQ